MTEPREKFVAQTTDCFHFAVGAEVTLEVLETSASEI